MTFGENPTPADVMQARVLPQPLLPVGGVPTLSETRTVAAALTAFATGKPDPTVLEQYLEQNPATPWRASILANIGVLRWNEGYYSRAARYWEEAWVVAKDGTDPQSRAVADFALGEWMTQAMAFGKVAALQARFAEIGTRPIRGRAGSRVNAAREGMWQLLNHHEMATFSGPEALKALLRESGGLSKGAEEAIGHYHPGSEGTTLSALRDLGARAGVSLSMRFVENVAELPVPSIVHLKSEHYSALVKRDGDLYVLRDPILGGEVALSSAAMKDEASGYVLVEQAHAGTGRDVSTDEAATVVGHCAPGLPYDDDPCDCNGPSAGMPTYTLHPMTTAVVITDTPLSYTPPVGPAINLTLRYNELTTRTSDTPDYGHMGPKWTYPWYSYVTDNQSSIFPPYSSNAVVVRDQGTESYNAYSGYTHWKTRVTLVKVSHDPVRWERRLPDGTVEVFMQPDRAASLPDRKTFLSQIITPQGHTVSFTYDSSLRLVAVTDAVGQVTTLQYEDATNPLLVTKVTDPFERTAQFTYDVEGRIRSITDAVGMTSSFIYSPNDAIVAMTTPYGTTSFRRSDGVGYRAMEVTDPEGGKERLEYWWTHPTVPASLPSAEVPAGFSGWNGELNKFNSLYWSKQAMSVAPASLSSAVITHWLIGSEAAYVTHAAAWTIPHSIKKPLESRVWYGYPNQSYVSYYGTTGTGRSPTAEARLMDDGTTQLTQASYNPLGQVTSRIDPLGRITNYVYASNGIDLLEVRQVDGSTTELLASYGSYNALHQAETFTDAAGNTTETMYDSLGRIVSQTNPKNETTTYTYDTGSAGQLLSVTGPLGALSSFTYDDYGRLWSVTSEGYTTTREYDALNRVVRQIHPDGTFQKTVYSRLDVAERHDRLGRVNRYFYDGNGRRVATRDPLGRTIRTEWCPCGSLRALVDANGNRVRWEHDVLGRITKEVRADSRETTFEYETQTSRLKSVTDGKGQVTTQHYFSDGQLKEMLFTNEEVSTADIHYTYDPVHGRLATIADGSGTTTYAYHPIDSSTNGAGKLAAVDGPLTDDTIEYQYDELGRVVTRSIRGDDEDWVFDSLGRLVTETNALGTFAFTYEGVSGRLSTVAYPNDQTSVYTYLGATNDYRLQTIHHRYANTTTLAKFDYTYNASGNILSWRQQANTTGAMWAFQYDAAQQLVGAAKAEVSAPYSTLQRWSYGYDSAGNRTTEQIDDTVSGATYNAMNQLVATEPSGLMLFRGSINEAATVTVGTVSAKVSGSNEFEARVPITGGTNTIALVARDASANSTTQHYDVSNSGSSRSFTYDDNGNLVSDGTRTFEWDARNQLVAVEIGSHRSEFTYDAQKRRVRTVERESGTIQSDVHTVWCDLIPCEERGADGLTTIRRTFEHGEELTTGLQFFFTDHLGSIRAVTNASGTALAFYAYDPWGRRTLESGSDVTTSGFTGHTFHAASSTYLTLNRAYDASLGRWLTEDPAGWNEGPNLYGYVDNRTTQAVDPLGLQLVVTGPPPPADAPPGCEASPWQFDGVKIDQWKRRQRWVLVREITMEGGVPGSETGLDFFKKLMDFMAPVCYCLYAQRGTVDTTTSYISWKRSLTCCSGGSRSEYARTDETPRERYTPGIGANYRITKVPVAARGCQCEKEL